MKIRMTVTVTIDPAKLAEYYRVSRPYLRDNAPAIVAAILESHLRNADTDVTVNVR